ncbi:UDP-N-acetylenolpyruvoylglucosamine reductase [Mycobacterium sp. E1715]|uniref:UDP-N-acetylmuramate dehydrogenase n=1 Tax=unclassified Mycobacterium TaxID=2642494 RepID=UPI0007FF8CE5|nr:MULTISPECIES: UDP-N-acetylmuramate dehydrogenase [unclassified Mycobacterium]OBG59257.1 UDP-N-acetylenolpyruvoylglucosamine reductase [Mycobacterium sp. E188]OBG72703.1 UDP-N-acetylenolpyruvoylglucosamine reductase [Mycobacterium sp. E3305]OBH13374.1 UDP-N-acetylenolpyruvoylglucosamine reductase [Mycobacterium sp. E1715]OBH32320.1 UDP-N-acetylenolpyruvoylglucosamine reductase [Mycobacterium sp. E183]
MKSSDAGPTFAGAQVAEAVSLAPLTTLRVGPVARRLITCASTDQVIAVVRELDAESRGGERSPVLVFAGGSNLVIADSLTDLTAVRLANSGITIDNTLVRAEAGAVWDDVVVAAIEHGLGGLECLSGIPGSAGATPVQNVGAYGAEVSDTITRVRILDRDSGEVRWVPGGELGFGYRTSVLKQAGPETPWVVLEVEFALDASGQSAPLRYGELAAALGVSGGERADPRAVRRAVLTLRGRKGMVLDPDDHDTWSVGSFFTNPVVAPEVYERLAHTFGDDRGPVPHYPAPDGVKLAAGWLVERAGFAKGYPDDPGARCRLSTKHALALTNRGGATTEEVIALARVIRDGVRDVFGVTLKPEPVLLGCRL